MDFLIKKDKIACTSCRNEFFSIPFTGLKKASCPFCGKFVDK